MTIDLGHNKIRHIHLSEFTNLESKLPQTKEMIEAPTVILKLENNPVQCECSLLEFMKFPKENGIKRFHKNIKMDIGELYCDGPKWMAHKPIRNLNLKEIKCSWQFTNNTDACNDLCTCWKFPEEK